MLWKDPFCCIITTWFRKLYSTTKKGILFYNFSACSRASVWWNVGVLHETSGEEEAATVIWTGYHQTHLVPRKTQEPQWLRKLLMGQMTTPPINALIICLCEGGGWFMTVLWCCSQTDAPSLSVPVKSWRSTHFQHMQAHPTLPPWSWQRGEQQSCWRSASFTINTRRVSTVWYLTYQLLFISTRFPN